MTSHNLPIAKNPIALTGAIIGLGLLSVLIRQVALLFPDSAVARLILTTGGYLVGIGLFLALAWLGWTLAIKALNALTQVEKSKPDEVQKVDTELDTLSMILSSLERANSEEAQIKIQDAQTATNHILSAAIAVSKRSEDFAHKQKILGEALEAVTSEDTKTAALVSGKITWDSGIAQMLLSGVAWNNDIYWTSVIKLISNQIGVYGEWGMTYQQYAGALVDKVAIEKGRVVGLLAASEFMEASRQLIIIERNLEQATSSLRLNRPSVKYRLAASGVKLLNG